MRRRRFQQAETGVSLFPFMAVLICAMGTLIVILVVAVRQAKVRADMVSREHTEQREVAVAAKQAELDELRMQRDTHQWRLEQLQQSRDATAADLAQQRAQLAHFEDHARRLADELKRLLQEDETLKGLNEGRQVDEDASQAELEQLKRGVESERVNVAAARDEAQRKPRSYAIIPYDGPHGTTRRPIYIECLVDRVILQPEGIVFDVGDFRKPLGADNPLAACLRAVRSHWSRVGGAEAGENAYPLLIVRTGGAEAYLRCRSAMKSWDDEFGYELVSDDTPLAYPPPDPALADVLDQTVAAARRRHEQMVMARVAQLAGTSRQPYLRATPSRGGFVMEGGPAGMGRGSSRGDGGGRSESAAGSSARHVTAGMGRGMPQQGNRFGQAAEAAGAEGGGYPAEQAQHDRSGSRFSDRAAGGLGGSSSPQMSGRETSGDAAHAPSSAGGRPSQGGQAGFVPPGANRDAVSENRDPQTGQPPRFGEMKTFADGAAGGASAGSLAEVRGEGWALPNAARGSTGVQRPIRIVCASDRLTIVPQQGSGQSLKVIPVTGSTKGAVDQFIAALWKRIEDWGIAGPSMHWKPELQVDVAVGGQRRFEELKQLLDGSGILVKQRMR